MRILVDIIHPAHVHFFRNAIKVWQREHDVMVTSRDKEMTLKLLDLYGIENKCLSHRKSGVAGLAAELVERDLKLLKEAVRFRPDVMTGIAGIFVAHVGKLIRKPSVVFYDTETAKMSNAITYPFASVICTPDCYMNDIGHKQVKYAGYHELAYLHPNRFHPDREVLQEVGVENEKFFLVRFVSWQASHDIKQKGISLDKKFELVETLSRHGKVFISSEGAVPEELKKYELQLGPEKMHDLIAFSEMVIGEGATVASEAAVLGVPSVYLTKPGKGLGYTNELEDKYGLMYNFSSNDYENARKKIDELLAKDDLREEWAQKRSDMLRDKIDVTQFVADTVTRQVRSS